MANFDYSKRLDSLKKRRQEDGGLIQKSQYGTYEMLKESYEELKESATIKYVIGAMNPVDLKYTNNTIAEGERIKNQLSKLKDNGFNVEFRYQGSVTNNTHIRAHSDIDVLTLHASFHSLEAPQKPSYPYAGDPVKDLCELREECYSILSNAFPTADIDDSGAKSIGLQGGSLKRKVDVVPSNWYNTNLYAQTGAEYHRGVMVLDYHNKKRLTNTPFYHNKLLDDKDLYTATNYKKMVRLLKTLKADSDVEINLSSYDIAALMYHQDNASYLVGQSPLLLITQSLSFLKNVYHNSEYRESLLVPDKSRAIFERATHHDLKLMILELDNVVQDIRNDLSVSGNTIYKEIIA
ncbi:nucleotidyltransferase family protein [Bacillus cereus]